MNSSQSKLWVLYLDHNHTKNTRTKLIEKINSLSLPKIEIKFIALMPEIDEYWKIGKATTVALSYSLFIECLARKLNLIKGEEGKINYIEEFHHNVLSFKKPHYSDTQMISEGIHSILKIPFIKKRELPSLSKLKELSTVIVNGKKGKTADV